MVNRSTILQALPAFNNRVEILEENQGVLHIMAGIKAWHKKFAADYDRIAQYFIGATPYQTCKNLFQFLKQNCKYVIEGLDQQTVRGPAAIVATGDTLGIDCKNYALFIGGVLDAINRSGAQAIPFVYRFASYDMFNEDPEHVFIVAYPGTAQEIWIDPVLDQLDQREPAPFHSINKKFTAMALQGISGTPQHQVGFITDAISLLGGSGGGILDTFSGLFGGMKSDKDEDTKYQQEKSRFPPKADYMYLQTALAAWRAGLQESTRLRDGASTSNTRARQQAYINVFTRLISEYEGYIQQMATQGGGGQQYGGGAPGSGGTDVGGMGGMMPMLLVAGAAFFLLKK